MTAQPKGDRQLQGRRYRITEGAAGVGLVLNEGQFGLLLHASELGWDAVVATLELIRTENNQ